MPETLKTLTFVAVAAAVAMAVVVSRPSLSIPQQKNLRGQLLYPKFTDPLAVASLEIVEFDEDTATVRPFQVAQVDVKGKTRWAIPSHDDYPADAQDQVASAAAGLMGLKILDVVGDNQGDQREYGVVDPDPQTLRVGATGVGLKVVMRDKEGKTLLTVVIGKEVPDRAGLRYIRKVGQDPIYVVEAKTDKLSTKFENWIERNLLRINAWDVQRLWIRDYVIRPIDRGLALIQRGDMKIEYDDIGRPRWKMIDDRRFVADEQNPSGGRWTPVKMADDEEINVARLNELISALDDLKIVDVRRKPAGLSADLKAAADFAAQDEATVEALARKGFFVAPLERDGPVELFSNDGEFRLLMKDGVEYVLRFGEIASGGGAAQQDDDEKKTGGGLNRYLFVMAEFDPDIIPKPQLEPLPEIKKEIEKKPAGEKQDGGEKEVGKETEQQAERQRIEKENKRKQDEYQRKIADGKRRVDELNARFADWYYIIPDEVYRKIHLTRSEIVKKKEKKKDENDDRAAAPGPAAGADDLQSLKEAGPGGK